MRGEFPLWSMVFMAAEGREPLWDWISLSVLFYLALPRSGRKPFLIFREIRNFDCADILTRFFSRYKLPCARSRAPTDVRGHNPPPHARGLWRALVSCGLCGPPFAVIPTPKNHIYSKIILCEILLHLDFIWYGYSGIQKTCRKQELALGTRSIG